MTTARLATKPFEKIFEKTVGFISIRKPTEKAEFVPYAMRTNQIFENESSFPHRCVLKMAARQGQSLH